MNNKTTITRNTRKFTRTLPAMLSFLTVLMLTTPASARVKTDLGERLRAAVEHAIDDPSAEVQVSEWRVSDKALLKSARRVTSFELLRGQRLAGSVTARAELALRGGKTGQVFVTGRVNVDVPVWVAVRRIHKDAPLGDFNVGIEMRPMNRMPTGALRATTALAGRVAGRTLSKGAVLTRRTAATAVLVRRGDMVQVLVKVGSVTVRTQGEAMRDGRVGDRVAIRLEQNRRIVNATVQGPSRVSILR